MSVKLTVAERWILSNQYMILAKLDPKKRKHYDKIRGALDSWYELHYGPNYITTNPDEIMTVEECREVGDILSMFQGLRQSYEKISDKSGISKRAVEFDGFDGNNETKQMAYTEYYCTLDGGRFEKDVDLRNLNSHSQRLPHYRAMLSEYKRIKDAKPRTGAMDDYLLTKEEILTVASAKP